MFMIQICKNMQVIGHIFICIYATLKNNGTIKKKGFANLQLLLLKMLIILLNFEVIIFNIYELLIFVISSF